MTVSEKTRKPKSRRLARRFAMQALYQWQMNRVHGDELIKQFLEQDNMDKADQSYFAELVHGCTQNHERIDNAMQTVLDRKVTELSPVEYSILRLAVFEFIFRLDVPYRVVINEAIELAKEYGANDGYKYINGVLNNAARELRAVEISQR